MPNGKKIADCTSLDDYKELLDTAGYLAPSFMTPTQLGYWFKELDEQFDQCYRQAHLDGQPIPFVVEIWGKFSDHLDPVKYAFRFQYDPMDDTLQLFSLYCRLDRFQLTYDFAYHTDLPAPEDVYKRFAMAAALNKHQDLFRRLEQEFRRDRDPANDYEPEEPKIAKGHPPPLKLRLRH